MEVNPYKSPESIPARPPEHRKSDAAPSPSRNTGFFVLAAFVAGLPVGWFAIVTGFHGGDTWPTIVFCAPAYLVAHQLGDNLGYVAALILGTGAFYGLYAYLMTRQRLPVVMLIHGLAALITAWMLR